MDHVLLHIPRIATLQLTDIFWKEEKFKNSNGKFCFKVWTPTFFERINELEKYLLNENYDFEIITKHKTNILKFIKEYKEEHYRKVMKNGLYYLYLIFEKYENKEYLGICGWYPRVMYSWEKKLHKLNHEERLYFCHLTEEEKNFKLQQKKINMIIYRFFLKKNIKKTINLIYRQII